MGNILKKYNLTKAQWEVVGGAITGDTLPIGAIMPYTSKKTPSNWLPCNGQAVSRTTYADLFAIIGTQYGSGDGSTTFNLPDLNSYRVPIGYDSGEEQSERMNLGTTGGEETHTLTIEEMPAHNHEIKWGGYNPSFNSGGSNLKIGYDDFNGDEIDLLNSTNTGGSQAHNNMQPYVTTNYIIKAKQSIGVVGNVVNEKTTSDKDTYSCDYINEKSSYSTEETVVGTWLGKPLYRKVYTTYTEETDGNVRYLIVDKDVTKEIINVYGSLNILGTLFTFPTPDIGFGVIGVINKNGIGQLYLTMSNKDNDISDFKCALLYTKTTD